jgi:predicted polyphosphate/ATP-dependent NAD kinase
VNPIAGMGGKVGLKGTDGTDTLQKAIDLGALPVSESRAIETMKLLLHLREKVDFVTYPSTMGEDALRKCGFDPHIIGSLQGSETSAEDTKNAARDLMTHGVSLILFAGGDGTARDVCEIIDQKIPSLGIPTGVKIHSSVFAINPRKAASITVDFLNGEVELRESEVMDVDEAAFRENRLSAKLYGYLLVPYKRNLVQAAKSASPAIIDERSIQKTIAEYIVEIMDDAYHYILGPGTTVRAISDYLRIDKTLLGVDVVFQKNLIIDDAKEEDLLKLVKTHPSKIIVSPIGGQGFIFGRGNQQISPDVIKKVGKENIIVIATNSKLLSIGVDQPLLIDTGNFEVDQMISGYKRVITGYNEEVVIKVAS